MKDDIIDKLERLNFEFDQLSWRILQEKDPEVHQELIEQRSEISLEIRVLAEQIKPNAPQNTH